MIELRRISAQTAMFSDVRTKGALNIFRHIVKTLQRNFPVSGSRRHPLILQGELQRLSFCRSHG